MYIVAIAWGFVALLMAAAEAISPQGTILGALITLLFYGVLPLSLLTYILGTPGRKRRRRAAEALEEADAGGHAPPGPAGGLPPEREEA